MAYQIYGDSRVGFQPVSEISTTKNHTLGTKAPIKDATNGYAGVAVYVGFKASTAVAAGLQVTQDVGASPFAVVATVAATHKNMGAPIYVNLTAVSSNASVQYGWVLEEGIAPTLKTAVTVAPTDKVFLSGTAGRFKVLTSAGQQILGCRIASATVTSTTSLVNIYYNRAATQSQIT
jgi:hypothetical protein